MGLIRGVLVSTLSLAALEALVSSDAAASRVGGVGTFVASAFNRLADPSVPLLPDLRTSTTVGNSVAASFTSSLTTSPAATTAPNLGGVSGGSGGTPGTGVAAVLSFARAQIGKPYKWGGAGPDSFDCSGLTLRAFQQVGVKLVHYSGAQALRGSRVASLSDAIPGDLVFFGTPVHHVAIYSGGGNMIEAPRTGLNVREVPVWATPSAIRRLIPASTSTSSSGRPAVGASA